MCDTGRSVNVSFSSICDRLKVSGKCSATGVTYENRRPTVNDARRATQMASVFRSCMMMGMKT